ncbi:MAG: LPS export ABC transporter periplasmic protein LptC [Pseudomonadota bacterium]
MGIGRIIRRVAFVVLIALALFTWLQPQQSDDAPEFESVSMVEARSDYYLEGFQILQSDRDGRTEYALVGALLSYDPLTDIASLHAPHLRVAQPDGLVWALSAERGTMPRDGRNMTLNDAVELVRTLPDGSQPSTLSTEQIDIDIDAGTIRGDEPVTLTGPGWQIDALGMAADTGQGALELTGRTHGRYRTQTP